MRQLTLVLSLWVCAPVFAAPPNEPTHRPRIQLVATLDPQKHAIEGEAWLQFVNTSDRDVSELFLHLYPNAFASDSTVFMREGGGQIREKPLAAPGGIELSVLEIRSPPGAAPRAGSQEGADLLAAAQTELLPLDKTQLRTSLPAPVKPGEVLDVHARFRTQLPQIVARSGYAGSFHMLAQWFPKLAKLEPDGTFASFPYHGLGEFYADFADYELRLRVPKAYVTAAGGTRVATRTDGEMREDTFVAERVHDIAAACDLRLERHAGRSGDVRIELYAPPGYGAAARRQLQLVAAGLAYFSKAYGAYPYPQLTVVLPPRTADGVAGMEYPTFFTSGGPWWALPDRLPDASQDVVAAHELAHQWFSGMIATNEVERPMLDEGLAEWSSLEFLRSHTRTKGTWLDPFAMLEATFLFRGHPVPSSLLPAYKYGYDHLERAIYIRPARVLEQVQQRYGRPKLMAAMRSYALAGRFRHPTFADFYAAFDGVFGAGWSDRELAPALEGKTDLEDTGTVRPAVTRFFPDVWFAVQAVLHAIGP